MTTVTHNYSWQMPDPGASANTWGDTLNATTQAIDAQVFTNQQGAVPIGALIMWVGATAPANWLLCQGQEFTTSPPYDKLYAVIGNTFNPPGTLAGRFFVPDLSSQFPLGADPGASPLGQVGGSFSYTLGTANLPSHQHAIIDVQHDHAVDQTPHSHFDPGHTHGVNESPHLHGSNLVKAGPGTGGIGPGPFQVSGAGNTDTATTGISIQSNTTGIQAASATFGLEPAYSGIGSTQATGLGTPFTVVPQYLALNFIVKYQ